MKIYRMADNIIDAFRLSSEVESLHHTYEDIEDGDLLQRIHKYAFWKLTEYNIDDLDLDEWSIDEDRVEEYVEKLKMNPDYPPVIIDNKSYGIPTIVDGTHRLNALAELGYKTVKAYVPYRKK
jgi:hypothetical protein